MKNIDPIDIADNELSGMIYQFSSEFVLKAIIRLISELIQEDFVFKISYLRHKPSTNCVVVYKIDFTEKSKESTLYIYSKSFTKLDYLDARQKAVESSYNSNSKKNNSVYYDDIHVIFYLIMADKSIRGTSTITDARKLRRILYTSLFMYPKEEWRISHKKTKYEILRFKPEKRILTKASTVITNLKTNFTESVDVYIKCYADDNVQRIFNLNKMFYNNQSNTEFLVPQPLYLDIEKYYYISLGVQGTALTKLLESENIESYIKKTAYKLSSLHSVNIDSKYYKSNKMIVDDAKSSCDAIISLLPEEKELCNKIYKQFDELKRDTDEHTCSLVHGDFYHDQVLIDEDNYYFIDFDRYYYGDSIYDVANFCAHIIYLSICKKITNEEALISVFIKSYNEKTNNSLQKTNLNTWVAFCLFQLAVKPFRVYEKDWRNTMRQVLYKIEKITS